MITPAKWQAKGGEKNEEFRKNIVPYMKEIIYYPDCRELFDISESDGISYYLVDSCKHYSKNIKNICKKQRYFNGTDVRDIQNSINIAVNLIVDKIKKVNNVHMQIDPDRTYWIKANTPLEKNYSTNNVGVYGGNSDGTKMLYGYINRKELNKHIADIDKYKVIMHFKQGNGYFTLDNSGTTNGLKPTNIFNPGEICKDDYMCLYVTDNETEALSFKSYLDTRFVRFLAYCGCIGDNASNQETWRFIPHPGKFDHIFTDVELYEKYNLTPEEIEIIESIIKERK